MISDRVNPAELNNPQRLARWNWPCEDLSDTPELERVRDQSERIERGLDATIAEGPRIVTRGELNGRCVHRIGLTSSQEPSVTLRVADTVQELAADVLGSYDNYTFYSFPVDLPAKTEGQWVNYEIRYLNRAGESETEQYRFWQAGQQEMIRVQGTSCNGVMKEGDLPPRGAPQNWRYALERHLEGHPVSVHLGLGDNLYADGIAGVPGQQDPSVSLGKDGVFNLPTVKAWFAAKDARVAQLGRRPCEAELAEAWNIPVTEEMKLEVRYFYFAQYIKHNNTPFYRDFLASTLNINIPDDHDSYDGRGSRPAYIEDAPCIQLIRDCADEYYSIFQKQISDEGDGIDPGFFGVDNVHSLRMIQGDSIAIAALDCRHERSIDQVISETSWQQLYNRLRELPEETKRVIITSSSPLTWPRTPILEDAIIAFFGEDQYGLKALSDDDQDAWFSHKEERDRVFDALTTIAQEKEFVITCMGGDIHAGGCNRVTPTRKAPRVDGLDYRVIEDVTTSPMVNAPLPGIYVRFIQATGKIGKKMLNGQLRSKFQRLTNVDNPRESRFTMDLRHWAILNLQQDGSGELEYFAEPEEHEGADFTRWRKDLYVPEESKTPGCCG